MRGDYIRTPPVTSKGIVREGRRPARRPQPMMMKHANGMAADKRGVALRGGHHCTQPLMHRLGVESTARASFYFYNTKAEVDRFVEVVQEIQKFFGG
jgi:hypothetical protein